MRLMDQKAENSSLVILRLIQKTSNLLQLSRGDLGQREGLQGEISG